LGVEVGFRISPSNTHFLCEIGDYAATCPVPLLRALLIGLPVIVLGRISGLLDQPSRMKSMSQSKSGSNILPVIKPHRTRGDVAIVIQEPF